MTIEDLGILRDVRVDAAGACRRRHHPDLLGMSRARGDLRRTSSAAIRAQGYSRRHRSSGALAGVDHRLDDRRGTAQAARIRHRPAASAWRRPARARLTVTCPICGSAHTAEVAHFGCDAMPGGAHVRGLQARPSRTSRSTRICRSRRRRRPRRTGARRSIRCGSAPSSGSPTMPSRSSSTIPPELADEYRFMHGQHVSLRSLEAGDDIRRSYSICSSPASGRMRVAVKRLSGGVFSAYAHDRLKAGDIIEVVTPIGRFNTPLDPSRRSRTR